MSIEKDKATEPLSIAAGSAVLANLIARDIMSAGDGPTPCQRIQFMGGSWPDAEITQGGFCESALAKCIAESLARHLPNAELRHGEKETHE